MDPPHPLPISVVIPVYADFAATKTCFESVLAPGVLSRLSQVVAVDDRTPEPKIARMLDALADRHLITLIRNQRNLGFVGSINRALQSIPDGDVILLNADTIVPPKFRRAAFCSGAFCSGYCNGHAVVEQWRTYEFSSALRIKSNSRPSRRFSSWIEIAAKVNAGKVVTIPNGIWLLSIHPSRLPWPESDLFRKQSEGDIWRTSSFVFAPDAMVCAMFVQHLFTWVTPAASHFGKKNAPSLSAISSCSESRISTLPGRMRCVHGL